MRTFDTESTRRALTALKPWTRHALLYLSALRLLPEYRLYAERTGRPGAGELDHIATCLFHHFTDSPASSEELDQLIEKCAGLIPDGEDTWDESLPSAQGASLSLTYVLDSVRHDRIEDAVWSLQSLFNAAYARAEQLLELQTTDPTRHSTTLAHPLVQQELDRQERDLREAPRELSGDPSAFRLRHERASAQSVVKLDDSEAQSPL